MSTEPAPLTIFDAVHRAVQVCDPTGNDAGLGELLARFEDSDHPIGGEPGEAEQRIAEGVGAIDPQGEDPSIQVAAAVATYLCYRRDEVTGEGATLIRLGVRAEFKDGVPDNVRQWLTESGIEV